VVLLLPLATGNPAANPVSQNPLLDADNSLQIRQGNLEVAGTQDEANWWNSTYIYRRYFNFTEPDISSRTLSPVHLYLTFTEGHCYRNSIRVAYYDDPDWTLLPFQTWNTTYDATGDYVLSTRVSFMVNVSKGATEENYYIYYAKEDVGSVSYPDFYPFVYKSYTFSLLSLVSYYDDNNYLVERYDPSSKTWDDPRNLDDRWSGTSGSVYPSNVPNGTLDQYEAARYEPNSYSYSLFHGYYAIYSNYPMAVSMGQGNEGSNPAINDWFPGVNEMSHGTGTHFVIGGVEGFDDRNEGKYWVQAHENNTEVWVTTAAGDAGSGWAFYNGTAVSSWPAIMDAGEYIAKGNVLYTEFKKVNSTKPVSVRSGDHDAAYSRDIWAFYPAIDGGLAGDEFYTIDMGNSNDETRVTNLGDSLATVDWWRNAGSGWSYGGVLSISANSSQSINPGNAGDSNPEDILHIKARSDSSVLMVEGVYNADTATDAGDWVPTTSGHRFGTNYKLWGINQYKFMIFATENAEVTISGFNDGTLYIPAGGMAAFRPVSSSMSLYHIESNASIGVVDVGRFSTSSPYNPTGDTGFGWHVPAYTPESDERGLAISKGDERHLFEFDITVVDLDGVPVEGASVTLYNSTDSTLWVDEQGRNRSDTTDSNGLVVFEGLLNATYEVRTRIDASAWLSPTPSGSIWVTNTSDHTITGSVTPIEITLEMASFSLHFEDLMGDSMDETPDDTTTVRVTNGSNPDVFLHYEETNSTGWARFYRMPADDYTIFVRYDGPVDSYLYSDMAKFGSWTISSSEFSSGSFEHPDWVLPLTTLDIYVESWDELPVENAMLVIDNENETGYQITKWTNNSGQFTFYRIVNGTWSIEVTKDDLYGDTPTALNDTESIDNLQGYISKTVELPISQLRIRVTTEQGEDYPVSNADVNVTLVGGTPSLNPIAQGKTNSTGWIIFYYIHGNISSPYYSPVSYNITVISGDESAEMLGAKVDYDWEYFNWINITTPAYPNAYTELNSTLSIVNIRWNTNSSQLVVGWYDRDGETTTSAISTKTWLNITVTYDGVTYFEDTWVGSGTWITSTSDINFTIVVNATAWGLNVIDGQYVMTVIAHSDSASYDDPAPMTIYIDVNPARTNEGKETDTVSEYYNTHSEYLFWLYDSDNDANVTDLGTYSYSVIGTSYSGDLVDNGNGTYSLSASALNDLAVGSYSMSISLEKRNYVNQTFTISLLITEVPMLVTDLSVDNYDWDITSHSLTFSYVFNLPGNTSDAGLIGVSVMLRWYTNDGISYLNVSRTLSETGEEFTYTFGKNLLPVGEWNVTITCSKANYQQATGALASFLIVSRAPTNLAVVGSDSQTIDWLDSATYQVNYTRISGDVGLDGATFTHTWDDTVTLTYEGDGIYTVSVGGAFDSGTYIFELNLSKPNHESFMVPLTITIRVPLFIEAEYGSAENPLEVYWTESFSLDILLLDQSTATPVDGATVSYNWFLESVIDQSGNLDDFAGGIYNISLDANDAVPQDDLYEIEIVATKTGASSDSTTIFVRILAVPNEIVLELDYYEKYYADVFDVRFYWNNTLDNDPVLSPDLVSYYLVDLDTAIVDTSDYNNGTYAFTVDTRGLGMNVFGEGPVYVIQIEMTRSGFQTHDFTTVIVLVQETDASLVIDPIDPVNWSASFDITAHLYDDRHGGLIWENAVITVSWGTMSLQLDNNGDGSFTGSIESDEWFSASDDPYNITFTYTMPNYVDSTNDTDVTIVPVEGAIFRDELTTPESVEVKWTNEFNLRVNVNNIYGGNVSIDGATVYYVWSGYPTTYVLNYQPISHDYFAVVHSDQVPAGAHTLIVRVDNENYTIPDLELPVNVLPVDTSLNPTALSYEVFYGTTGLDIMLTYEIEDAQVDITGSLTGATITMEYAGTTYTATYQSSNQMYRLTFNPSEMDVSEVPGMFTLNISAVLENYTSQSVAPILSVYAETSLTAPDVVAEEGDSFLIAIEYLDISSNSPIGPSTISSLTLQTPNAEFTLSAGDFEFNGTHYVIELTSSQVGEVRAEPYQLFASASAPMYRNQTEQAIRVTISEQTIGILGIVRLPVSLLQTILIMTGIFVVVGAIAIGYQRWRIPFQIKQINGALKDIEDGDRAEVEGIKNMGEVVSDLLAPGLAELDMEAPTIDVSPEQEFEELGGEADELLDELDALDEIDDLGEEMADIEATDYEEELSEELDSMMEEEEAAEEEILEEEEVPEEEGPEEESLEEEAPPEEESLEEDEVEELEWDAEDVAEEAKLEETELEDLEEEIDESDETPSDEESAVSDLEETEESSDEGESPEDESTHEEASDDESESDENGTNDELKSEEEKSEDTAE
jgi:hypothetical protein